MARRSFDQFANLVMEDTVERIIVGSQYAEVRPRLHMPSAICKSEGNCSLFCLLSPRPHVSYHSCIKHRLPLNKVHAFLLPAATGASRVVRGKR